MPPSCIFSAGGPTHARGRVVSLQAGPTDWAPPRRSSWLADRLPLFSLVRRAMDGVLHGTRHPCPDSFFPNVDLRLANNRGNFPPTIYPQSAESRSPARPTSLLSWQSKAVFRVPSPRCVLADAATVRMSGRNYILSWRLQLRPSTHACG